MTLMWVALPPSPTYVRLGPTTPATIPGRCAIADGVDPGWLAPLEFSTVDGIDVTVDPEGWTQPGVASIGCPAPIATENQTWGGVKALY